MSEMRTIYKSLFLNITMDNMVGSNIKKYKDLRNELIKKYPEDVEEIQKAYYVAKADIVGLWK